MMRSIILGFLLAFSIVLNIGTLAVTSVATVVSGLFESVTGIGSVLGAAGEGLSLVQARLATTEGKLTTARATNVDLTGELDTEKGKNAKMKAALDIAAKKSADLDIQLKGIKKENGDLLRQNADQLQKIADLEKAKLVTYRGNKRLLQDAVSDTSRRISTRTATGASRNLAATFGEAWPVAGTAVIVTATTLELYDACVIMQDLHELDVAFNPNADFGAAKDVCGLRVPTVDEIWEKLKSSPGEAWALAKGALPDLPEMPEINWTFWN
jgi:hypothetical protein